jgi:hypothetical protein
MVPASLGRDAPKLDIGRRDLTKAALGLILAYRLDFFVFSHYDPLEMTIRYLFRIHPPIT